MQRKKVFGNKKKKEQLKQKRALKQKMEGLDIEERQKFKQNQKKQNKQKQKNKNPNNKNKNKNQSGKSDYLKDLRTVFEREDPEVIEKRKEEAKLPIEVIPVKKFLYFLKFS